MRLFVRPAREHGSVAILRALEVPFLPEQLPQAVPRAVERGVELRGFL